MKNTSRSILQIVDEQVKRWEMLRKRKPEEKSRISVVTVSREPGSDGRIIAQGIADELGFDLFHQEIVNEMANSAKVATLLMESLDEKGLNFLEDSIASVVHGRQLWPDQFLKHLMKTIGTIAEHGQAVIVGRGANFIVDGQDVFKLRIVAPRAKRVSNLSKAFGISEAEMKPRLLRTEAQRRAFVRKYFYSDISDPMHYDLVVNMANMSVARAVNIALFAIKSKE